MIIDIERMCFLGRDVNKWIIKLMGWDKLVGTDIEEHNAVTVSSNTYIIGIRHCLNVTHLHDAFCTFHNVEMSGIGIVEI